MEAATVLFSISEHIDIAAADGDSDESAQSTAPRKQEQHERTGKLKQNPGEAPPIYTSRKLEYCSISPVPLRENSRWQSTVQKLVPLKIPPPSQLPSPAIGAPSQKVGQWDLGSRTQPKFLGQEHKTPLSTDCSMYTRVMLLQLYIQHFLEISSFPGPELLVPGQH